jgi:hypothetical protein
LTVAGSGVTPFVTKLLTVTVQYSVEPPPLTALLHWSMLRMTSE